MEMATEPESLLLSAEQKAAIERLASDAGLTTEEFLLRAAMSLQRVDCRHAFLDLLDKFVQNAERTCTSIDETLAFVAASEKRMAALETGVQVS